jgi:hypothetical protein
MNSHSTLPSTLLVHNPVVVVVVVVVGEGPGEITHVNHCPQC